METHKNKSQAHIVLIKSTLIIIWYYLVSFIVMNIVYLRIKDQNLYEEYVNRHENMLMIVIYMMLFLGIWAFDNHKATFIKIFKKWQLHKIIQYMLWGLGAYFVCNIITSILLPFFPEYNEIGNMFNENELFLSFIAIVILPPIVEEYIFRHKLQSYFKEVLNKPIAIIMQALLFGILHGYVIQQIYAFLMGLFFGIINNKENTVRASLVMHMTVNGIGWFIGSFFL